MPTTESQARPLAKLEPDEQRTAWDMAITAAETMKEAAPLRYRQRPSLPAQTAVGFARSNLKNRTYGGFTVLAEWL